VQQELISAGATSRAGRQKNDKKGASSLPLDLAGKILTVLDVGIGDLLEVVER